MTVSRRHIVAVVAMLGLIALVVGLPRLRSQPERAVPVAIAVAVSPASDESTTGASSPPSVTSNTPVGKQQATSSSAHLSPPETSRIVELIGYWRAQAIAGTDYAQCRLAQVAQPCTTAIAMTADWELRRFHEANAEILDRGEVPDCRGVVEADIASLTETLLRAAARGHVPSQVLFASGATLSWNGDIAHPERSRPYREQAATMAWRAFDAGDTDAAVLLWRAYNDVDRDVLFLSAVIQRDPIKAHALDQLMLDLAPDHIAGSARDAGLSDEQAMQAQALLAEWRSGAFAQPKPLRFGSRIENMFDWEKRAVDLCAPAPQ